MGIQSCTLRYVPLILLYDAQVGAHTTNGVAAIHTELVKHSVFPDFFAMFPDRFQVRSL
jgi:hypothetical protein